jgi:hypothetical protein
MIEDVIKTALSTMKKEDKYKVDKTKPPKPIQLKDASGIHELSDERNYEFLNKLFEMKELDPFIKEAYDVNAVYQLMDPKGKTIPIKGFYTPKEHKTTTSQYMSSIPEWQKDFETHGPRLGGGDVRQRDVVAVRHKAFRDNPDYKDIIKDTKIGIKKFTSGQKYNKEEIINRAFDAIYFKEPRSIELLKAMKFSRREMNELNKAINALTKDFPLD